MVPNIVSSSSCLHVAFLVLLRVLAVTKPLGYEDIHKKLRHIILGTIWILSICVCILPVISERFHVEWLYTFSRGLVLHGLHTVPIIAIIILYVIFFYTIHKSVASTNQELRTSGIQMRTSRFRAMAKSRQMKMMKGVVVCLVVCYVPYLIWWEYNMTVCEKRAPYVVNTTEVTLLLEINYPIFSI